MVKATKLIAPKVRAWNYDREYGWHTLPVAEDVDAFVFVYKTPGGDYAVSAQLEGDPSGGEVVYRPNLRLAKEFAETLAATQAWKAYAL